MAAKLRRAEELLLNTAIDASLEKPARRSSSQPSSKLSIRPPTMEPTSTSQPEVCHERVWQATPARLSLYVCRHASPAHRRRRGRQDVPSATPNAFDRLISA